MTNLERVLNRFEERLRHRNHFTKEAWDVFYDYTIPINGDGFKDLPLNMSFIEVESVIHVRYMVCLDREANKIDRQQLMDRINRFNKESQLLKAYIDDTNLKAEYNENVFLSKESFGEEFFLKMLWIESSLSNDYDKLFPVHRGSCKDINTDIFKRKGDKLS